MSTISTTNDRTTPLPAHHDPAGKGFTNPWPSFYRHGILSTFRALVIEFDWKRTRITKDTQLPNVQDLDKFLIDTLSLPKQGGVEQHDTRHHKVATTWLG
ncbi:hypothetical protein BGZ65_008093, partial [Modicella reniformis]